MSHATGHARFIWKTRHIASSLEIRLLSSAWQSSCKAFGPNRTFTLNRYGGGGEVETDLPWSDIRALFRHAGVKLRRDQWVIDTLPLEKRVEEWEREDKEERERKARKAQE